MHLKRAYRIEVQLKINCRAHTAIQYRRVLRARSGIRVECRQNSYCNNSRRSPSPQSPEIPCHESSCFQCLNYNLFFLAKIMMSKVIFRPKSDNPNGQLAARRSHQQNEWRSSFQNRKSLWEQKSTSEEIPQKTRPHSIASQVSLEVRFVYQFCTFRTRFSDQYLKPKMKFPPKKGEFTLTFLKA